MGRLRALTKRAQRGTLKGMTTQSFRVGDVMSAENVDEVPEWACVQSYSEDHIWRRVGDRWQTVGFGTAVPSDLLQGARGYGSVVAVDRRIVGLNCTAAERVGLGRELAAQGWAPAVEWLRRHGLGASFKVGDNLTKEQVRDLPVGAVIERDDYPWQREADGWRPCGVVDGDDPPLIRAMYETSGPGRLIALNVRVGDDRAAFRRALAEQGYEPARRVLAERAVRTEAVAHDDFVQSTAALFEPVPKVGDLLTDEQIAALPLGAVTYQSKVPNPVFIYRKTASGWDAARLEGDPTFCLSPRNPDHGPPAGVQLIALGCDAPSRAGLMRQLAESGHEAAHEWLCQHADHPLVRAIEPTSLRLSVAAETGAAQDALGRLADEMATLTPPLPAVGEVVTPEMLDRLPVGAVVDAQDGTSISWAQKLDRGWAWIRGTGEILSNQVVERALQKQPDIRLIALESPEIITERRRWCAERGYRPAAYHERRLTEQQVRKQIIDERNAPPQNQDMATSTTQITTQAGTYVQRPEENAPAFLARIAAGGTPDVQSTATRAPLIFSDEKTQPSALTRFVDAFKGIGADFAKDGVKAVVDSKALVLVDGSRLALHGAAAQIAEWVGGESAVEKVQRATQNPLAAGIEDVLVVIGATLTGQQGLAAAVRGRVVRRIVDGAEGAIVAKGAAVVTQLAQAAKALGAASAAAELPAESTAAQTEGEVQS